jgi:prevent-host-death family protein
MVRELTPVDVGDIPELARLVDEVKASDAPLRITRDGEDVAVLMPVRRATRPRRLPGRRPSEADIQAALAVAGSWGDQIDPEVFKRERRELQVDDKPPRSL